MAKPASRSASCQGNTRGLGLTTIGAQTTTARRTVRIGVAEDAVPFRPK